jgi:hypothetical protein
MEEKKLKDFMKKHLYVGVKLNREERTQIEEFCIKNEISISDLVRYSVKKVINEVTLAK